jgi:hypothetical protein
MDLQEVDGNYLFMSGGVKSLAHEPFALRRKTCARF